MRRFLSPFVLTLSTILIAGYVYVAFRLGANWPQRWLLALPFLMVWIVPAVYWAGDRESSTAADELVHAVSYLCMGWLNFLVLLSLARDALLAAAWALHAQALFGLLDNAGPALVFAGSFAALTIGLLAAFRGPHLRRVTIPVEGLHPALNGLRIVQISDLHVGPTIGERYVKRVVQMSNELNADLIVLTGDIVDGPVSRLARHVAPLGELRARHGSFFILGNHDCYAGAQAWTTHFRSLGMQVLLNEYRIFTRDGAKFVVGGVVDPALSLTDPEQKPRPDLAAAPQAGRALRILLAHNPSLASLAQEAGFDLQLSGHTHAGQFFPWTIAVRLVHAPHVAGLSRLGSMWVYVNAGTGTWGPPVRFGTEPELTLLQLTAHMT
ncbi:metallophosphoesterase [Noviherbaspirillum sp.]|uniref:metallophosphoesterase n=1 Tax=Noviherbaspirillum sp. TaxID=1926288 RepID=UPI002B45BE7C|nr:metallophosphoesterase [Noviherbaspirillum sp.]HJV80926.1 metallophosphoesterase [Noviherbaspirillum sp.]HJW55769.1 metallophosphoesterase [Burkholderiaceae bacterium]